MCEFPSWIESDKEIFFLTDKDLSHFASENEADAVGHHGLRRVYPNLQGEEGEWFPCPAIIAKAIHRGKMNKLMRLGGYKAVYIKANGKLHRDDGPAIEWADGSKEWWKDGKLHRDDGPAVEWADGSKVWYKNGKRHRDDGPAIERADGSKQWWKDGKRHRDDGPAIERADGSKQWWKDGKRHRDDGPAIEWADGSKQWWKDGRLDRDDGPAVEWANGSKEWWKDGKLIVRLLNGRMGAKSGIRMTNSIGRLSNVQHGR